jgi:hypothetical protein
MSQTPRVRARAWGDAHPRPRWVIILGIPFLVGMILSVLLFPLVEGLELNGD